MLSRSVHRLIFLRSVYVSEVNLTRNLTNITVKSVESEQIKTERNDAQINFDEFMKETPKPKMKRKSSTEPRISKDIQSYFNNKEREFVLKKFPEKFLRKKIKTPENLYICDEECAEIIADYITKSDGNNKPVIEINPGIGMLTKHLLQKTNNDLMLYENNEFFNTELNVGFLFFFLFKLIFKNDYHYRI